MEAKLLTGDRFVDRETGISYRYILSDTEYFRPHYHDYYEIFIILEGEARHLVNGTVVPLKRYDTVFVRPSDIHDYVCHKGDRFSMLNITFDKNTARLIFDFLGDGFPARELTEAAFPPAVSLSSGELTGITNRMTAISTLPSGDVQRRKTALRLLVFEIFTKYFSDFTPVGGEVPPWLEVLCGEVRKNGFFREGSEGLFSLTDKSREHVCRCMKKYMGVTVSEFINGLRMNYICNMLANSNHSITEIVYESGFNNMSHAAECFKKKYGMTMRDYRNTAKRSTYRLP